MAPVTTLERSPETRLDRHTLPSRETVREAPLEESQFVLSPELQQNLRGTRLEPLIADADVSYRGMRLSPSELRDVLGSGLDPKRSWQGFVCATSDASLATAYSLRTSDPADTEPRLSVVLTLDTTGLDSEWYSDVEKAGRSTRHWWIPEHVDSDRIIAVQIFDPRLGAFFEL